MKHTVRARIAAFYIAAFGAQALNCQDVILSEVRADTSQRWVEIHNRGAFVANLSTWSLYYATATPGQPQRYWWPFPTGTTLAPGGYLRVFWFQNQTTTPAPDEHYTGTSPYGFLFGLGGEQLHGHSGAFALLDTQQSSQVGSPTRYVDWVSWGQNGFMREPLAVQNGVWTAGVNAPAIPPGHSLARHVAVIGAVPTHEQQWFLDSSPTPMANNISGMVVTNYGQGCTANGHHLLGMPQLQTASLPLLGNAQFGYTVQNTTGFFGESMLLVFSAGAAPASQTSMLPFLPGPSCQESIHTGQIIGGMILPTNVMETHVPLSLAGLPRSMSGIELHCQAMVFDWLPHAYPPFQGVSNAVMIVVGN